MVIFYLVIICIIIFFIFQRNLLEGFTKNPKVIILVGDSILDNERYAQESITDQLIQQLDNNEDQIICLAEDNSTIKSTMFSQIPDLTKEDKYNHQSTYIFVSVGGNDILQKIVYQDNSQRSSDTLYSIMTDYYNFVANISKKMSNANIILMTLYYPQASHYRKYDSVIKEWNIRVKECAKKYHCRVLDLSKFMTNSEDFSHDIEPSDIGGKKLTENMISAMA